MRAKETFVSLKLKQDEWETYKTRELYEANSIVDHKGYTLDTIQPQIGGERYLMSGHKLVLFGSRKKDGKRVVIKISSYPDGIQEILRERNAQHILHKLNFAVRTFFSPEELDFFKTSRHIVRVTAFVQQDKPFLSRDLDEQFFLALRAFETQEGVHATTYSHALTIKKVFGLVNANDYLSSFEEFKKSATESDPENVELKDVLNRSASFLYKHRTVIERYCGFLTHHDLSLHNLRVVGHDIYLLDHTSLYFGNKYEGWARFLNYMTQYNPRLETMLLEYVKQNRGEEEYLDLRLMRIFKLGLLLQFHTNALKKTSDNLKSITRMRITFWIDSLRAILEDKHLPEGRSVVFREQQEKLRSEEEKERNKEALSSSD